MKATAQMGGLTREEIEHIRPLWLSCLGGDERFNALCDLALRGLKRESVRSEALKECEYALQQALRTGKVGWLQETAHEAALRALSPARVAEGELRGLSLDRDGDPLHESPAKEQPGEQNAAPAGGGSQPVDTSTERDRGRAHAVPSESPILAVPQVAAPDVASMVRRLRKWPHDPRLALPPYEEGWNDALHEVSKLLPPPPERP